MEILGMKMEEIMHERASAVTASARSASANVPLTSMNVLLEIYTGIGQATSYLTLPLSF
jgi:hypothetical protein